MCAVSPSRGCCANTATSSRPTTAASRSSAARSWRWVSVRRRWTGCGRPGSPSAHGTAVASLIARAAPGTDIYVADVYGPTPAGGSAQALARALDWLAQSRAPVINISLVGPPNLLLAAAVKAAIARGLLLVAPVGNDGPAAPPLYPAAYPGVIAVTGVDAHRRVLFYAGGGAPAGVSGPGAGVSSSKFGWGVEGGRGMAVPPPLLAGVLVLRPA